MKFGSILTLCFMLGLSACASTPEETISVTENLYNQRSKECLDLSNLQDTKVIVPGGGGGGDVVFGSVFTVDMPSGKNSYVYADCMREKGFPVAMPQQKISKPGHFIKVPTAKDPTQLRWSGGKP